MDNHAVHNTAEALLARRVDREVHDAEHHRLVSDALAGAMHDRRHWRGLAKLRRHQRDDGSRLKGDAAA